MSVPPDARRIAASVLTAVLNQGVFATATLDRALRAHPDLDPRDRALATEIVYGTLRTRGYLAQELRNLTQRGLPKADPEVESLLLVAAYQLLFLDRVPAFAVVDAAVTAITEVGGKSLGGFANAVLRRLSTRPRPALDTALIESVPRGLFTALEESIGPDGARAMLGCTTKVDGSPLDGSVSPPPSIRLRPDAPIPEWLKDAEPGPLCPNSFLLPRHGDLQQRAEWHAGHYVVQEQGAMFAGLALGAKPGETILDACAGRGQKSSLIAEVLGPTGQLWATDVGEAKLRDLRAEFTRLGLPEPHTAIYDWTKTSAPIPSELPSQFDRILVDAPCSGTGTLRHRPEITLRLRSADVERLAVASERILRRVAEVAGPSTTVLFVVCSVLTRECEGVIERVSDVFELAPFEWAHPELEGRTQLRLLPHVHGTDGFFLASLRRR